MSAGVKDHLSRVLSPDTSFICLQGREHVPRLHVLHELGEDGTGGREGGREGWREGGRKGERKG